MTTHQRWTQTDISDLRSRVQDRATLEAIADATGRAPEMVERMIKRLRLRTTRL